MKPTTPFLSFKLLLVVLCLWPACHIKAQEFTVRSFRVLPYDITAYIDPVRDLNDEVCALLKVVGDKDFAFSSPLGIVKRKNDVGEIWLYLPKGSILLTVKHPQWGVLRDYRFPQALESRMTYELVLTPPLGYQYSVEMPELENRPCLPDTACHRPESLPSSRPPRIYRPLERWHRLALLNAGLSAPLPASVWESCGGTALTFCSRKTSAPCPTPGANATATVSPQALPALPTIRAVRKKAVGWPWPEASTGWSASCACTKASATAGTTWPGSRTTVLCSATRTTLHGASAPKPAASTVSRAQPSRPE